MRIASNQHAGINNNLVGREQQNPFAQQSQYNLGGLAVVPIQLKRQGTTINNSMPRKVSEFFSRQNSHVPSREVSQKQLPKVGQPQMMKQPMIGQTVQQEQWDTSGEIHGMKSPFQSEGGGPNQQYSNIDQSKLQVANQALIGGGVGGGLSQNELYEAVRNQHQQDNTRGVAPRSPLPSLRHQQAAPSQNAFQRLNPHARVSHVLTQHPFGITPLAAAQSGRRGTTMLDPSTLFTQNPPPTPVLGANGLMQMQERELQMLRYKHMLLNQQAAMNRDDLDKYSTRYDR
ncbi:hypothetical protein FGO68_gene8364 [Halteria grandinella]|uniref:Uncharacterized protein n=1 Tax=Halteria grandinella TaxID=5974 RepID=A0A8J8P7D2_HALGN|nr:hypothetical protein FGO68_gene8364 [Halteria grandinella]